VRLHFFTRGPSREANILFVRAAPQLFRTESSDFHRKRYRVKVEKIIGVPNSFAKVRDVPTPY